MRTPLTELLEVDLARLSLLGWVLILTALGLTVFGCVLVAQQEDGYEKWQLVLCLIGGGVVFVAGRTGLRVLGRDIYRTPRT